MKARKSFAFNQTFSFISIIFTVLLKLEDASPGVNIVMMMFFELLFFNSEIFLSSQANPQPSDRW